MICNKCGEDKPLEDFSKDKSNKRGRLSKCKLCDKRRRKFSKYNISEEFLDYLYSYTECMCCGNSFKNALNRHIHHIDEGVQGLVCQDCNFILGQETDLDLLKIESVLAYAHSDRKILCRLSELPRRPYKNTHSVTQCNIEDGRQCSSCKNFYTEDSFYVRRQQICFKCERAGSRLRISKPVKEAKQKAMHCDCCNDILKEKQVHHVGDIAYGIICRHCNLLLRDESKEQIDRLFSAKLWIEQESLEWIMA